MWRAGVSSAERSPEGVLVAVGQRERDEQSIGFTTYSPTTIANVLRERQLAAGRQTTSSRRLVSVAVNARQYGTVTANSNMQRSRTGSRCVVRLRTQRMMRYKRDRYET